MDDDEQQKEDVMAKRKHTLVISKAQRSEPTILQAIAGDGNIADSSITIVESYFARERYENLVEQGYDVKEKGFAKENERVYGGAKETALRSFDWKMEECEATRVDRDPFDTPHLEKEKSEDYDMDTAIHTELSFVDSRTIELEKAKIRRTYSQYFTGDNVFVSESITIEITNHDLEERMFFKIGSKCPIKHSYLITKMGEQPIKTVEKGSVSLTRNKERNTVTMLIHGKKDVEMVFSVSGFIWMAMVVAKYEPKVEELEEAL